MSQWIVKPNPKPQAEIRLLCFPYAGGGASIYVPWKNKLPDNVELNIVQPPGRGMHFSAKPIGEMSELIAGLLPHVEEILRSDYIIFGHSVGSRVGFELIRQALKKGFQAPLHFFASGSSGPDKECFPEKVHELPDDEFITVLKNVDGTPSEVLQNRELIELFMPALRADFKIAEEYSYRDSFTMPSDITVLSGIEDKITHDELRMWQRFGRNMEIKMCGGGHFFIDTHQEQVLDIVNAKLKKIISQDA